MVAWLEISKSSSPLSVIISICSFITIELCWVFTLLSSFSSFLISSSQSSLASLWSYHLISSYYRASTHYHQCYHYCFLLQFLITSYHHPVTLVTSVTTTTTTATTMLLSAGACVAAEAEEAWWRWNESCCCGFFAAAAAETIKAPLVAKLEKQWFSKGSTEAEVVLFYLLDYHAFFATRIESLHRSSVFILDSHLTTTATHQSDHGSQARAED